MVQLESDPNVCKQHKLFAYLLQFYHPNKKTHKLQSLILSGRKIESIAHARRFIEILTKNTGRTRTCITNAL